MKMITIFVLFSIGVTQATTDVCKSSEHLTIPNLGFRYINYRIERSDVPFNDFNLEDGWYYVGNETMPEYPPDDIYTCGTKFPVWLKGTHPTNETSVTLTACQANLLDNCTSKYEIKIKNCGGFFVYHLTSTTSSNAGYCFGKGKAGEAPKYVVPKPKLHTDVLTTRVGSRNATYAYLACDFIESKTENLYYIVSWYMNSKVQYVTSYRRTSSDPALRLTEMKFKSHGFTLGNTISCGARAFFHKNSAPGKPSEMSENFFAGIRVLTPAITLNNTEDSTMSIRIQPTMPIGCQDTPCYLRLLTYIPDNSVNSQCAPLAFKSSSCGVKLYSQSYSVVTDIPVKTIENGQYHPTVKLASYQIYLKVDHADENMIWNDYAIPPIKVDVIDPSKTRIYEGKKCHSINDPHIMTFDGRYFDNHQNGEYILYQNTKYHTEVQSKYYTCGHRDEISGSPPIKCNCGLAVRAGQDLFTINVCDQTMFLGYKLCGDKTLEVKSNGELKYKIIFSYGTYVDISIQPDYKSFSVHIVPSSHDESNTLGLCGILDGDIFNDFHTRPTADGSVQQISAYPPGKQYDYNSQPKDFLKQWRVYEHESLFSDNVNTKLFTPWSFKACVCTEAIYNNTQSSRETENYIPCSPNAIATCTKGKNVGSHSCSSGHSRRRRSLDRMYIIPEVNLRTRRIHKRNVQGVNMTENEAKLYCKNQIGDSSVFSLCSKVPSVNTNSSLDICVADIMLTGTTVWTAATKESMQDSCLSELKRNTTLRERKGNMTSIAQEIEAQACPNDCSAAGLCNNGECDCDAGFGGSDCSIDLSTGPTIAGLLDNGLCDEKDITCDHAYVFGNVFTDSENLTCRLEEFSISDDGKRQTDQVHYAKAEFETLIETVCSLRKTRRKRSIAKNREIFVSGYTISVSNDGHTYEDGADLFIYDSTCQLVQNTSNVIHFNLKDGFCFIDNTCVSDGIEHPKDKCLECDVKSSTKSWSTVETIDCHSESVSKKTSVDSGDSSNYLWIIGVVAGVLVGVAVGILIAIKLAKKRGKRVSDSSVSLKQSNEQGPRNN